MIPRRILFTAILGLIVPVSLSAAPVSKTRLEDYRVSYDALLANRSVEDAYKLALDVSRRYPDQLEWKRRLARVAIWTNRQLEGYNAWKDLFNAGVRDKEVMSEVRRLATYYDDAPMLIELWHAPGATRNMSEQDAKTLATLYERENHPIKGAHYFESLYQERKQSMFGVQAARLYERAGNDADAVRIYHQLLASSPANGDWLLAAARLEVRHDRLKAALKLLKEHQSQMPDNAFEFWQMLGDLAWMFQDDATAMSAYQHATSMPKASKSDRDRLTNLLMDKDPLQAAAMSLNYYHDGDGSAWLQRALEIQVGQKAWKDARESLAHVQSKDVHILENDARFLMLRAMVNQHFGENASAVEDMRQAVDLAPDSRDVLLNALWVFIGTDDRNSVQAMLTSAHIDTEDPLYWEALAAAYQALGRNQEAIVYTRRQLENSPDNPVLLLNYAELCKTTGQEAMAMELRQRAWKLLQKKEADGDYQHYLARVRTELSDQPGDAAALRVRRLKAQSRDHASMRELDDVLLVWALENGQIESARAWSRARYNDPSSLPLWAQLQLALATYDYETLQRLLDSEGDRLSPSSGYDAAMRMGRWPQARQLAFEGAQYDSDSNTLHQQLIDSTENYGNFGEISGQQATYSDLDRSRAGLKAEEAVSRYWRLGADGYAARQTTNTLGPLRDFHLWDIGLTLNARARVQQHEWNVGIGEHDAFNNFTSWNLGYKDELQKNLQLELLVAGRQPTEQSTALQIAGHADRALIDLGWTVEQRLQLSARMVGERYHTQYDNKLGSGHQMSWEASYRLHDSYPDWNVRAYGDYYHFKADGLPDAQTMTLFTSETRLTTPASELASLFVPKDNTYYGLCSGVGQNLRTRYSHALRPMAEACTIHNKISGRGYSFLAGLAGSLSGPDHLALLWQKEHAGSIAGGRDFTAVTLNYRYYFW